MVSENKEAAWLDMEDTVPGPLEKGGRYCEIGDGLILTPFDIFRLAKHFSLTQEEWIDRFCEIEIDRKSGIPTVRLRPDEGTGYCPFHTEKGCSVCRVSPESCRAFPLERRVVYICSRDNIWKEVKYAYPDGRKYTGEQERDVKVRDWLDRKRLRRSEGFICSWADALCDILIFLKGPGRKIDSPEQLHLVLNMSARLLYYEYDVYEDFHEQFDRNVQEMREKLSELAGILENGEDGSDSE